MKQVQLARECPVFFTKGYSIAGSSRNPGFFTDIFSQHDDKYRLAAEPVYRHLQEKGITHPNIVDIGSSGGRALAVLASYLRERGLEPHTTGIEPQFDLFRHMPQVLDEVIEQAISPNNPLPYKRDSVDVLIAHKVWYFIGEAEGGLMQNWLLTHIASRLKPQGVFFGNPVVEISDPEMKAHGFSFDELGLHFRGGVEYKTTDGIGLVIPGAELKRLTKNPQGPLHLLDVCQFGIYGLQVASPDPSQIQ